MKRMADKIVQVSGGAGGIGSSIAQRMAAEGATILVTDILSKEAERVAGELGNGSSAFCFDAYDQVSIEAMVQAAIDRYGRLDVLVNNVADTSLTTLDKDILNTDIAIFDRSIAANLRSIFIATKAALPHLLTTQGAIVNIASGSALSGDTWLTAYASAKAGVLALTKNTAVQYGKHGVRCNAICPGVIAHGKARRMMADTLRSALDVSFVPRNGAPEDIAALATFLASADAGFMNGANVVCDGGHSIATAAWRSGEIKAV
jgi:NAD(P)-dependent dehydrogenase (short-subunit alcohol dehydrogenase family)